MRTKTIIPSESGNKTCKAVIAAKHGYVLFPEIACQKQMPGISHSLFKQILINTGFEKTLKPSL